jgi:DNA-binding transcriptional LysR family regulator
MARWAAALTDGVCIRRGVVRMRSFMTSRFSERRRPNFTAPGGLQVSADHDLGSMRLQFLRYFVVLAEELHFGRAASRLAITQPPLSAALKALENEVGVELMVRTSKQVRLTPAGAASIARSAAIGMNGRLYLGFGASLLFRDILEVVRRFNEEYPDIEVEMHEMPVKDLVASVLRGDLHAGLTNAPSVPPPLESFPLADDHFVLCMPDTHPKASLPEVDIHDISGEPFVMFSRDIGPVNYDALVSAFHRLGIHPKLVHRTRSWLSMMVMVSRGCGLALLPSTMSKAGMQGVRFVPVTGMNLRARAMLVWNPESLDAPLRDRFVDSARCMLGANG